MSSVNRILIDSRFRQVDSKSTTDFRVELPETIYMDSGMTCVLWDICLPVTWLTVEPDVNDKLYFRIYQSDATTFSDYIMNITSRNYNRSEVVEELNAQFLALGVDLRANEDPYRNLIRIFLPVGSNLAFMIFTNLDLRSRCNNTWRGEYYSSTNPQSINDMIGNAEHNMKRYTAASIFEGGQFNAAPYRTLYITCPQLGNFRSLGPQGERDFFQKVMITSNVNEIIYDSNLWSDDFVDVSRQTLRSLNFRLVDVYGNVVNLHGQNFSFSLVFKPA
jgi:hypothetical protein